VSHSRLVPYQYPADKLGLSAVTLEEERTSNRFGVSGREKMTVFVDLAEHSAATVVKVNVDATNDKGTTWFPIQAESISSGTGTLTDYTAEKAVSAADTFEVRYLLGFENIRIRVSGTSGAAGDVVSVTALVK
jgi:hypothetical protein